MFFAHSTQVGLSILILMMLYINPSIEYFFLLTSTSSVSTGTNGVDSGRYSYLGSKFLCGDFSYNTSCDV